MSTLVPCLCLCLVVVVLSATSSASPHAQPQHRPRSPPLLPPRPHYGRIGLCPYVKRAIPDILETHRHLGNSGEPPSLCGNLCTGDHECPDTQKCCPTHCGYSCFDPVFIVD